MGVIHDILFGAGGAKSQALRDQLNRAAEAQYDQAQTRPDSPYVVLPAGVTIDDIVGPPHSPSSESQQRKDTPIFSGVMRYFPDALAAVARLSKKGNDKHNPGEPLHWARGKSTDHGDCIARHQITFDQIDPETGEYHAVAVAWRALAQLQLLEEQRHAPK